MNAYFPQSMNLFHFAIDARRINRVSWRDTVTLLFGAMSNRLSKEAFSTFGRWACGVGVAFFGVYPTLNWLTARRTSILEMYMDWELSIPFVPELVWVYLSMYVLFPLPPLFLNVFQLRVLGKQLIAATMFSGLAFLLFPGRIGFVRVAPETGIYADFYSFLFVLDDVHNVAPSLHVVYSAIIVGAIVDATLSPAVKAWFRIWLGLLCASTLLVHQHHVIDVASGLAVAVFFRSWIREGKK